MANNVQTEAVTTPGAVFATHDVGGVHYPLTKLAWGPDGSIQGVVTNSTPLPVVLPNTLNGYRSNLITNGTFGGAGAELTMDADDGQTIAWEVQGGLVGTVEFLGEIDLDGSNRFPITAMRLDGSVISTTSTFPDRGYIVTTGLEKITMRVSAYTSGSVEVRMVKGMALGVVHSLIQGEGAHDAPVNHRPVLVGAFASSAVPSAVTAADLVRLWGDLAGRTMVAQKALTATVTSVGDTTSSTQLLAATDARLGAVIYNDSAALLFVKLGTTASSTDFTVMLAQDDYYEVPYGYYGRIDGIWTSDAGGSARITEIS